MKNYTTLEINSLIARFELRTLPKVEWTHEAHLVVAIWYCSKHEFEEALALVREYISEHNEAVGTGNTDEDGYHESITKFWLLVASDFLKKQSDESIAKLCNDFINSAFGESHYPLSYYSKELLFSVKARHQWIAPDKKAIEDLC